MIQWLPIDTGYEIPDQEAAFLALHFINSISDGSDLIGYTVWGCIDPISFTTGEMKKRCGFIYVDCDNDGSGAF